MTKFIAPFAAGIHVVSVIYFFFHFNLSAAIAHWLAAVWATMWWLEEREK